MTPAYTRQLDLTTQKTSVGAQKIDSLSLETYEMISASFLLQDSLKRTQFFEETLLLAYISMELIIKMPFLAFSSADFQFRVKKLT